MVKRTVPEIQTTTNTASRIALSFMMTTAILVIGNIIAASLYVYLLNFSRPTAMKTNTNYSAPTATNQNINANRNTNANIDQTFSTNP